MAGPNQYSLPLSLYQNLKLTISKFVPSQRIRLLVHLNCCSVLQLKYNIHGNCRKIPVIYGKNGETYYLYKRMAFDQYWSVVSMD